MIGDFYRFAFLWRAAGSDKVAVNNLYFRQQYALVVDTALQDFWGIFQESCLESYRFAITADLSLVQIVAAKGTPFVTEEVLDVTDVTGGSGGDRMSPRQAAVLSYRTALPTKKGRGRIFLPPAGEADNTGGRPSADYRTNLDNFGAALLDLQNESLSSAGWQWQMYSKTDDEFRAITAYGTRDYWGSRRKRRLY